jgi:hypothetical protein
MPEKQKTYIINKKHFTLRNFEDYTLNEETKIAGLLGIKPVEETKIEVKITGLEIYPLILESKDVNVKIFDFGEVTNRMLKDILTDYWVGRSFFLKDMQNSLVNLIKQKSLQTININ